MTHNASIQCVIITYTGTDIQAITMNSNGFPLSSMKFLNRQLISKILLNNAKLDTKRF